MPRRLRPCPVPGCERHLGKDNRVSLVCEFHRHTPAYCQCRRCLHPRKTAPLTWNPPSVERHTFPSGGKWFTHSNGCRTKVTADTAEQAERFLARMMAHA